MKPARTANMGQHPHGSRYTRRGSGYLLVVGAAMFVSLIGLSSLVLVRVQQRTQQVATDSSQALLYARSMVEAAVAHSATHSDWRTSYTSLTAAMPFNFDRGSCLLSISEPDGSALKPNWDNPVLITGFGSVGNNATPNAWVRLSASAYQPALPLLGTVLYSPSSVTVSSAHLWLSDGPLATDATLTNQGIIHGSIEAKTLIDNGNITGTKKLNGPAKTMPDSTVFDYYRTLPGTVPLPAGTIGPNLEWVVLSPDNNPWQSGNTSIDGVYYIQPSGDLTIRNTRILGTLIVDLTTGRKLKLDVAMLWEPARPDFPSLIVKGNCEIRFSGNLSESNTANFNPANTPYRDTWDSDKVDVYTSSIKGLFHVVGSSSTLLIANTPTIQGTILAEGPVTIQGDARLTADPNLLLIPPIKYRSGQLQIEPGSWKPVVTVD